jgi:hypothetical protein
MSIPSLAGRAQLASLVFLFAHCSDTGKYITTVVSKGHSLQLTHTEAENFIWVMFVFV